VHEIMSEPELQSILAARQGFLANKKESGGTFVVHDLQRFCKSPLKYSPKDYPKFFSETTSDFDRQWGTSGWDLCNRCSSR
jgi:hypothetical protein